MNGSIEILDHFSSPDLSVTIAGVACDRLRPGNGGLRLMAYPDEGAALAEAHVLASCMDVKHAIYNTGFAGIKVVARAADLEGCKPKLLSVVAEMLNARGGSLYTGCDLNISLDDVAALKRRTPYVLAALGSPVNPSAATGHGVASSFEAALRVLPLAGAPKARTVLVHGVGAVGRTVARRLVGLGLEVFTCDRRPERAALPGCRPLSADSPWWRVPHDATVLCSTSHLITEEMAAELPSRLLIAGANAPFATPEALAIVRQRGVVAVPDAISNAGAVIADSIEHFNGAAWRACADPEQVYAFVDTLVGLKTSVWLDRVLALGHNPDDAAARLQAEASQEPCGLRFRPHRPQPVAAAVAIAGGSSEREGT
jgi:leucine dehydrogenase